MKKFYVYVWKNLENGEVFYVGKGCGKRYRSLRNRNKFFLKYVDEHKVESSIVEWFDNEEDAFAHELELTTYYKSIGQCSCSLMDGGFGGYSKVWSKEMRTYWSEYNPMKTQEQRDRMSKNNPMKDSTIAQKVGEQHYREVIINGTNYRSVKHASKELGVVTNTITSWCKRGYDTDGNPCRYANEPQKDYKFPKTCSKAIIVDGKHLFNSIKEATQFFGVKDSSPLCKSLKENRPYHGHIVEYANQHPS